MCRFHVFFERGSTPPFVCVKSKLDFAPITATGSPKGSVLQPPFNPFKALNENEVKKNLHGCLALLILLFISGSVVVVVLGGWEVEGGRWGVGVGAVQVRKMTSIVPLCGLLFLFLFLLHLQDIMNSEKSYDSLPNFTAADCEFAFVLRLPSHCIELTKVLFTNGMKRK